ncbi:MAG TPA: lysophospholipid acyltransferase family protein [Pseudolysinimonas sp.]|nr:lysophospholipid acyltransferase family protein [Pseudolysinimonas sp.]
MSKAPQPAEGGGLDGDRSARAAEAAARTRAEKTPIWRFLAALVVPAVLFLTRFRFRHAERIPAQGPFLMVANHYSDFDPLVTAYTLWKHGRVPHYLAKASLFRVPVVGAAFRATDQVPVERAIGGAAPLAAAKDLIDKGLALVIYPEGTLTREPDMWPMRGKYGAARLALQHGIPVIPAASWGAQRVLPRWSKRISLFPRKEVEVILGEPLDLSPWVGKHESPKALAAATELMMDAITGLLEQLRDEKAPSGPRWDPAAHGQSEFGRIDPGS